MRGATWVFTAHVHNERNGAESVEVVGGGRCPGEHHVRSFLPARSSPSADGSRDCLLWKMPPAFPSSDRTPLVKPATRASAAVRPPRSPSLLVRG